MTWCKRRYVGDHVLKWNCTDTVSLVISFFKQYFIWNIFWREIKLVLNVKTIRLYGLEPCFSEVYYPATVSVPYFFMGRIRWETLAFNFNVFEIFFHSRNWPWIETDGNLKVQNQGCMLGVVAVRFLPNSEIVIVFRAVWDLALSCYKRTLFLLTNAGYFVLKISWTRPCCWEWRSSSTARPFGTNSQWIVPSKFHQKHNITLGPKQFC